MADHWSDQELALCVDAYLAMVSKSASGQAFTKKAIYADLTKLSGRSEKSIELRMQNISAVLMLLGYEPLKGLAPAANVGTGVTARLNLLLEGRAELQLLPATLRVSYKLKIPAMRDWLICVAKSRSKVFYSDVMQVFDVDRFSLRHAMDVLGYQSADLKEPIITALIVSKGTGRCSSGLQSEFGVADDIAERERLYQYWSKRDDTQPVIDPAQNVRMRAIKFASVEARPDQASFRRKVYEAYNGMCAISGCAVGRALDAAHKDGRDWRKGHNEATDGVLMRKDLHALYDVGLLKISLLGEVMVQEEAKKDYGQFDGLFIAGY